MGLKLLLVAAVLAGTAAASLAVVGQASANFAASDGFSGRNGSTCVSCHADPHPLYDDARAVLEGLPDSWLPGAAYSLTIRVEGGPLALPPPAPQGGFEIEASQGRFRQPAGFEDLLRQPLPWRVSYEPAGSLRREWTVEWIAPGLEEPPAAADFWLAV
ncbi:MAG TPA: choice-of-anchor V domain-containing protein, partial [Candidatus Thermoplasmatota archaeon]|nr:choice-of-anchor V domain-containing protein [Candidatus Thermoplasmatota archaeon]